MGLNRIDLIMGLFLAYFVVNVSSWIDLCIILILTTGGFWFAFTDGKDECK